MKAMILAAGKGTRLQPFTLTKPKALFPVGQYTLLQLAILYLKKHGITEFVINVHHFADQVIAYLRENNGFGLPYHISDETDELLDTGGAIVKARKYLEGTDPFVLIGIDVLTGLDLSAMINQHKVSTALVTLAVKKRKTSRSLVFDENYRLRGWRDNANGKTIGLKANNRTNSLGFSVVHVINPRLFDLITEEGAFSITKLYLRLMETEPIKGYRHDDSEWIEFGRMERIPAILESAEFKQLIKNY